MEIIILIDAADIKTNVPGIIYINIYIQIILRNVKIHMNYSYQLTKLNSYVNGRFQIYA